MIGRRSGRRARRGTVLAAVAVLVGAGVAIVTTADASTPPHVPFGRVDSIAQTATGLQVRGWAIDPDTTLPIPVHVYVNGHIARQVVAGDSRPDVGRAFGLGAAHGYTATVAEAAGTYNVCVYAINYGLGSTNPQLGCRSITLNYDPRGAITSVTQFPGGFIADGWAVDPSEPATALKANLLVDGSHTANSIANLTRGGIPGFIPAAGSAHGWSIKVTASEGTHHLCLYAINVGAGSNATIDCRDVQLNFSPVGAITGLVQRAGGFQVSGWASDPDTTTPITVSIAVGGTTLGTATANGTASGHNGHGFTAGFRLPGGALPPGNRTICVTGKNLGTFGSDRQVACKTINLNYNPTVAVLSLTQKSPGARITGWTSDPDTGLTTAVIISADGATVTTVSAGLPGTVHTGHNFDVVVPLRNGTHTVCAVAVNRLFGNGNSAKACQTITLNFNPFGSFENLQRASDGTSLTIRGWAIDPDTTGTIPIRVTVDGVLQKPLSKTGLARPDIAAAHPGTGSTPGYAVIYKATDGEHRVCVSADNVLGGSGPADLGCRLINAVHPTVPSAPRNVKAVPGYGQATVTWTRPASDGGAPWGGYIVSASPGGASKRVASSATSTTMTGLAPRTPYTFSVVANNVAGDSPAGTSAAVTTLEGPPPQTTPAPISTSRYIRNITGATSSDLAWMRSAGATDASHNPSGHRYLMLLDIGGQDQSRGGVLLSATTRYVSYPNLVADIKAYVDGYASRQQSTSPAVIAIGTNNDVDVSAAAGAAWANSVIDPVRGYAGKYTGITIAGANDIEPGFRGTYAQTQAWLSGYLGATLAKFVNNGSADGCSWTVSNSGCNNGWSMSGLYNLSAGAAPSRLITLPQVYNNDMAAQWKFISLTGIGQRKARIDFGGPLTEWTACAQAGSCGSLTGRNAWIQMWNQLQSHPSLRVTSLPYSTDLRIDR